MSLVNDTLLVFLIEVVDRDILSGDCVQSSLSWGDRECQFSGGLVELGVATVPGFVELVISEIDKHPLNWNSGAGQTDVRVWECDSSLQRKTSSSSVSVSVLGLERSSLGEESDKLGVGEVKVESNDDVNASKFKISTDQISNGFVISSSNSWSSKWNSNSWVSDTLSILEELFGVLDGVSLSLHELIFINSDTSLSKLRSVRAGVQLLEGCSDDVSELTLSVEFGQPPVHVEIESTQVLDGEDSLRQLSDWGCPEVDSWEFVRELQDCQVTSDLLGGRVVSSA